VQICRRGYTVTDKETGMQLDIDNQYIMSPKDLKTIHFLNKILDAGVSVLKIEGRARGPEYVKTVVECYKEAVEAYENGEFEADSSSIEAKIADWDERLARVFNRGWWDGYYLGQRLGEWTHEYGSRATRKKVYAGKVTNYFKQINVAEFFIEAEPVQKGDEFLVTGETTGAYEGVFDDIRIDLKQSGMEQADVPADTAVKGVYFSCKTDKVLHRGDKLFKLVKDQ
jgi:putative protease